MEIEYAKYYFIEWTIQNEWYSWISRIQTNIQYYNDSSNINNSSRCKSMSIDILYIMGYSLHLFYRYNVYHSYSYIGSFCKLYGKNQSKDWQVVLIHFPENHWLLNIMCIAYHGIVIVEKMSKMQSSMNYKISGIRLVGLLNNLK